MNPSLDLDGLEKLAKAANPVARQASWDAFYNAFNPQVAQDLITRVQTAEARLAVVMEALELVLPLAKGYAAEHRVGSNERYVKVAEQALNPALVGTDQSAITGPQSAVASAKPGIPQGELRERVDQAIADGLQKYCDQKPLVENAIGYIRDAILSILPSPAEVEALRKERDEAGASVKRHSAATIDNAKIIAAFKEGRMGTSGCACVFDEDGETILRWCYPHSELKLRAEASEARASQLAEALRELTVALTHDDNPQNEFVTARLADARKALAQPEASAKATTREDVDPDDWQSTNSRPSYCKAKGYEPCNKPLGCKCGPGEKP